MLDLGIELAFWIVQIYFKLLNILYNAGLCKTVSLDFWLIILSLMMLCFAVVKQLSSMMLLFHQCVNLTRFNSEKTEFCAARWWIWIDEVSALVFSRNIMLYNLCTMLMLFIDSNVCNDMPPLEILIL